MNQLAVTNTRKKAVAILASGLSLGLAGCGGLFGSVNPYQNSYTNWVEDYSTGGGAVASNSGAYVGQPLATNTSYNPNVAVASAVPANNSYAVANTSVYVPAPIQTNQVGQNVQLVGQPLTGAVVPQVAVNNQPLTIEPLQSEVLIEPISIVEPVVTAPVVVTTPVVETPAQPIEIAAPAAPIETTVSIGAPDILQSSASSKKGNWLWPVDGGQIYRAYDPGKTGSKGALLKASIGSTVRAASDGEVVYVGYDLPGLGNLIIISHSNSLASGYGYVGDINVSEGDTVKQGQAIAKVEGINSQEPVLHFEVRKNNEAVNPISYVKKR